MSANNKLGKINRISEFGFAILIINLIFLSIFLTSCEKQEVPKYSIIVVEEKDNANVSNEETVVTISETNQTSIEVVISNQSEGQSEGIGNETNEIAEEQESGQEQEQIPARASAVEFYFLLKGKSYFRYILKETELKAFNMSGTIIRIVPIFIANDSVVFKVDDYPTGAIDEKEWYSTPGFEIYVSEIYYRG